MLRRIAAALLVIAGSAWPTQGADYPNAPVTLVTPFPQGGSTGYTAKVLADELQKTWRQPVSLEVKSGNFGIDAIRTIVGNRDGLKLMVGSVITNSMRRPSRSFSRSCNRAMKTDRSIACGRTF